MNSDFPRIITLLRKESGASQKTAATDLGVSQALLSHYEKGIRECGLEFLVKVADYYSVSSDYLLGRSPEPAGKTISYEDIPEQDLNHKDGFLSGGVMMMAFSKKLIINSLNILFSLLQKCGSETMMREGSNFLMLAIYRVFRTVYGANKRNDQLFFTLPEVMGRQGAAAAMLFCEAKISAAAQGITICDGDTAKDAPPITTTLLSEEFPLLSSSLLNVVKNSEAKIQLLQNAEK